MNRSNVESVLIKVQRGEIGAAEAARIICENGYSDIGYASIDTHRRARHGFAEIIFCPGKKREHVAGIIGNMMERSENIIATRADEALYEYVASSFPDAQYFADARIIFIRRRDVSMSAAHVLVISAGTADFRVAEEAFVTAQCLGVSARRINDVGVAGIHRLSDRAREMSEAAVVIAVAGMEGALASVVGGMCSAPVIAVPTSVGYGASFGGIAALLGMLNSCSSGVTVVNIDNGFGAAYAAAQIISKMEGR